MSATKLTETRWADRCVMLPPRLNGVAAQRVVKKLVDLGLIEEVRARGDLPVWRRDHGGCPMAQGRAQQDMSRVVQIIEDGTRNAALVAGQADGTFQE